MAPVSAVIEDTPVAVLEPKNLSLNSVSETIPLDSEVLPMLTLPGVGMLISTQLAPDKLDILCLVRRLLLASKFLHMRNGIHVRIAIERPRRPDCMVANILHK